jgi:hypothetical protein
MIVFIAVVKTIREKRETHHILTSHLDGLNNGNDNHQKKVLTHHHPKHFIHSPLLSEPRTHDDKFLKIHPELNKLPVSGKLHLKSWLVL